MKYMVKISVCCFLGFEGKTCVEKERERENEKKESWT